MANRKLFVPKPNLSTSIHKTVINRIVTPQQRANIQSMRKNGATPSQIDNFLDSMNPGYKQKVVNFGMGKVQDALKNMGQGNNTSTSPNKYDIVGGPYSVCFPSVGKQGSTNSSYALSKAPNPREVRLNSYVRPNTYANDYMTATEVACSPLHLAAAAISIPTNVNNPLTTYFEKTICFDIQNMAQANVAFDLDVATQFSSSQMVTAFNAGINALQVYFYYASILSYESDTRNKNEGMIALRNRITPQMLSDLTQLGRRLEDTPMPSRVVELIRYLSMNFLSGDNQGAPLLKLMFNPRTCTNTTFEATVISSALTALALPANNTVYTLLRKTIPQWRIGTLYDVSPVPVYDPQFLTIFANLPSGYQPVSTAYLSKTVASTTQTVNYNTFSNKLDGVAYALCSVWDGTQHLPGLTSLPFGFGSTIPDSRLSYYRISNVGTFYGATTNSFLRLARQETSTYDAANVETQTHLSGAEKCQNVCAASLSQTAQNAFEFLFDLGAIPLRGQLSSFSRSGKI